LYALIWELERRWGVWYAMGGTGALVDALARLFEDLGGEIRCDREVVSLEPHASRPAVSAVRLRDGEQIRTDLVVCNADVAWSHGHLLPPGRRRPSLTRARFGMSVFVLYFGTNRRYDSVAHHEILLGPRYRGLIDDIFRHGRLTDDLSLYVHRPTATDETQAPAGCDAFYALAPVPHLGAGIDWAEAAPLVRDRIVARLEDRLLTGLSRHIVTEHFVDPRYFRDALNSHLGAAFSLEPILSQSAWFRPHATSDELENLYYVGAGTHPGAGIPGVLSSAKIVAGLVEKRFGRQVQRTASRRPSPVLSAI
jgi:phytoene desaturase